MADLLKRIAQCLACEMHARNSTTCPTGTLAVHIGGKGWDDPTPLSLELWPCPANPRGEWKLGHEDHTRQFTDTKITLGYVELQASRESPTLGMSNQWDPVRYPAHDINFGFEHYERFWEEDSPPSKRAPGLLLPRPGIAQYWPKLEGIPNVDVELCFHVRRTYTNEDGSMATTCSGAHVLLASRFAEDAVTKHNYKCHNTHLFAIHPPLEWSQGKQFGDARY